MSNPCIRCGAPTDAYICRPETRELADQLLVAAGHAEDAEAVITRQTRYGAGGRGGTDEPLPLDLTAAGRLAAVEKTIGKWTRHILAETDQDLPRWKRLAGPLCPPTGHRCPHASCEAIRRVWPGNDIGTAAAWLATQTEWLRKRPEAGEAYEDLERACEQLARLVDRPADKELVGVCDCGRVLYAPHGRSIARCPNPTCKLVWNVAESRGILAKALRGKLFTASECARLATFWHERTQPQIRALITGWTRPDRLRLHAHGWIPNDDYTGDGDEPEGWPTYLLGDVLDLLAQTPRRNRQGAAA